MRTRGAVDPPAGDAAPRVLFPDELGSGMERTLAAWNLSAPLPIPRRLFACPICDGALALKDWKYHRRDGIGSASPWRCDVRMKCMGCGYVPTFGVLVPQEMYDRAARVFGSKHGAWIHWRVGREVLEDSDGAH